MATRGISIEDAPDGRVEDVPMSAADGLEGQAEEEEGDADNAVEEEEEEVDMAVSLIACLENTVDWQLVVMCCSIRAWRS